MTVSSGAGVRDRPAFLPFRRAAVSDIAQVQRHCRMACDLFRYLPGEEVPRFYAQHGLFRRADLLELETHPLLVNLQQRFPPLD